jgi:hypothetical protein
MLLLKVKPKAKHINSLALWSGIIVSNAKNIVKKLIQSCSKQKVVKDITQRGTALWFTYKINHVLLRLQIEPTGYSD